MKVPTYIFLLTTLYIFTIAASVTTYNAFYLVFCWPPSYCKSSVPSKCNKPYKDDNFTLHGMWLVNIGGHSPNPKKWKGPPFDANMLINSPIIGELNKLWPNFDAKQSNTDLWEHEWVKHGICTGWDLFQYYKKSIDKVEQVNILRVLETAGITPNNAKYNIDDIKRAFNHLTRPIIHCNKEKSNPEKMLFQVYFCLDRNGEQFQDCPLMPEKELVFGCKTGDEVVFP
ncbi:intracellular ribonuclease LX-like [Hevea brasiliensis]|uniref:intracellular ribonuclease LX-like n=1 Tax=Hevea brasiliensis TaxID=3981 RepID=UPI0025F75011|nr:intracellular ribonuclease LX-like [Hevea brasiliensis]